MHVEAIPSSHASEITHEDGDTLANTVIAIPPVFAITELGMRQIMTYGFNMENQILRYFPMGGPIGTGDGMQSGGMTLTSTAGRKQGEGCPHDVMPSTGSGQD